MNGSTMNQQFSVQDQTGFFLSRTDRITRRRDGVCRVFKAVVLVAMATVAMWGSTVESLRAQTVAPTTLIVWSEPDGNDFDVWFSQVIDEKWTAPERVEKTPDFLDALPCAAETSTGHVVVWTRFVKPGTNELVYAVRDAQGWGPAQSLKTGMSLNMASTLARDSEGTLWLGWAGFDGSDDDIYVSRWESDGWSARRRVNRNDFQPDVLPQLAIGDDGKPRITWRSLESSGYVEMTSQYDGQNWSEESLAPTNKANADGPIKELGEEVREKRLASMPEVPDFVSDPGKSCMTVMDTFPIQTLRLPKPALVAPSEG